MVSYYSTLVGAGIARPRSKTFEEYSKETDDIWDDKEEDFSDLSLPSAGLDFSKTDQERVVGEGSPRGRKGKGKCKCFS